MRSNRVWNIVRVSFKLYWCEEKCNWLLNIHLSKNCAWCSISTVLCYRHFPNQLSVSIRSDCFRVFSIHGPFVTWAQFQRVLIKNRPIHRLCSAAQSQLRACFSAPNWAHYSISLNFRSKSNWIIFTWVHCMLIPCIRVKHIWPAIPTGLYWIWFGCVFSHFNNLRCVYTPAEIHTPSTDTHRAQTHSSTVICSMSTLAHQTHCNCYKCNQSTNISVDHYNNYTHGGNALIYSLICLAFGLVAFKVCVCAVVFNWKLLAFFCFHFDIGSAHIINELKPPAQRHTSNSRNK